MSQQRKLRRPSPPHNPGLRELIEGKRRGSSPSKIENLKHGFRGWHERGYLPHRDEPGLTQFVTFHLTDSFPSSLRSEWEHLARIEDAREQRKQIEAYLDKGRGECHLRRSDIAMLVQDNFRMFGNGGARLKSRAQNGDRCDLEPSGSSEVRYELRAWCIMPNHVHVLFKVGSTSMSKIVEGWKKHTGRLANKVLGKEGAFWEEDYFDTYMRDIEHERKTIHYIENNPTKAMHVVDPKLWPWSSARFRNEFGALHL